MVPSNSNVEKGRDHLGRKRFLPVAGSRPASPNAKRGTGMLELVFAIAVVLIGLLGYSRALVESAELEDLNRETALATEAARRMVEGLYGTPFGEVYARFNADPGDDGLASGPAPGNLFAVAGLGLRAGDADGNQGEIIFPTQPDGAGSIELREDLQEPALGMPLDLNLDGVVDGNDHSLDYRVLPVLVRIEWESGARQREFEVRTFVGVR